MNSTIRTIIVLAIIVLALVTMPPAMVGSWIIVLAPAAVLYESEQRRSRQTKYIVWTTRSNSPYDHVECNSLAEAKRIIMKRVRKEKDAGAIVEGNIHQEWELCFIPKSRNWYSMGIERL